jgi:hypothetical protein
MGFDLSAYPLDGTLPPELPLPLNGLGRFDRVVARLACYGS